MLMKVKAMSQKEGKLRKSWKSLKNLKLTKVKFHLQVRCQKETLNSPCAACRSCKTACVPRIVNAQQDRDQTQKLVSSNKDPTPNRLIIDSVQVSGMIGVLSPAISNLSHAIHYVSSELWRQPKPTTDHLDTIELEILIEIGAFEVPPRPICDKLLDVFFRWVAPVIPVVNRQDFMQRYQDINNPPSILLQQAIFLVAARYCAKDNMEASSTTIPPPKHFFDRAKALYNASFEQDHITVVQALVLMGQYWERPEGACDTGRYT